MAEVNALSVYRLTSLGELNQTGPRVRTQSYSFRCDYESVPIERVQSSGNQTLLGGVKQLNKSSLQFSQRDPVSLDLTVGPLKHWWRPSNSEGGRVSRLCRNSLWRASRN